MKKSKYISAFLAFVLWGVWAYFVNQEASNRLVSAFFQAIASASLTMLMVDLILFFSKCFENSSKYFLATLTVSISSSLVFVGHWLIHTSNILYTMIPTIFVSFVFALFISNKVIKRKNYVRK